MLRRNLCKNDDPPISQYPVGNWMFKVNNSNTRTSCEICSKLTIKIPERSRYFTPCSSVSIVNFEHRLCDINWTKVRQCRSANEACISFLNIIESLYDECFPVAKISSKQKKYFTHWITRVIKKSTKKGRNYKKISKK